MPWIVMLMACGDDSSAKLPAEPPAEPDAAMPGPQPDAASADAGATCTPRDDCLGDLSISGMTLKACCSSKVACGYALPELDEENKMYFPQVEDFLEQLTGVAGGRCAPADFFFGPRPGLWKHRVEVDGGEDILITPDCESYTVLAYILPGCCLADDTCGLSTDESWPTLESLVAGMDASFARPECVSAEELNQQFRDSVALEGFARTSAMGSCNHAALAAELAD